MSVRVHVCFRQLGRVHSTVTYLKVVQLLCRTKRGDNHYCCYSFEKMYLCYKDKFYTVYDNYLDCLTYQNEKLLHLNVCTHMKYLGKGHYILTTSKYTINVQIFYETSTFSISYRQKFYISKTVI